jgi:hypothetical protein
MLRRFKVAIHVLLGKPLMYRMKIKVPSDLCDLFIENSKDIFVTECYFKR